MPASTGLRSFRQIQLGVEAVNSGAKGTAVTPTVAARWLGNWEKVSPVEFVDENVGILIGTDRAYTPYVMANLAIDSNPFTFEQFPLLLAAAVRGQIYGVADGGGSDYIYTYTLPDVIGDIELVASTTFVNATSKIQATGIDTLCQVGDTIEIIGSGSNDGIYRVTATAAGEITVATAPSDEGPTASVTTKVLLQSFTARVGNNKRAQQAAYVVPIDLEITGQGGGDAGGIMFSANLVGRTWASASFATISLIDVNEPVFPKAKFYLDAVGGTMGGTEKAGTLLSFTYRLSTGIVAIFGAHGQLYFYKAERRNMPTVECDVELEMDSVAIAEFANWEANTPRLMEIKLEGEALGTGGTTYSVKTARLQMPGKWSSFDAPGENEGGDVLNATFTSKYNATYGAGPSIIVVNELANLIGA